MLGSAIFVSAFTVHVRKRAFEKKFDSIIEQSKHDRDRSGSGRNFSLSNPLSREGPRKVRVEDEGMQMQQLGEQTSSERDYEDKRGRKLETKYFVSPGRSSEDALDQPGDGDQEQTDHIVFSPDTRFDPPTSRDSHRRRNSFFSAQGVGARPTADLYPTTTLHSHVSMPGTADEDKLGAQNPANTYLPSGYVSRNSQFYGLSANDRLKLGGVEYKAICFLAWIVPLYFILFQLLGCVGLAAYVAHNRPSTARENGLNPWWVGAFNGVSAFGNSGMSLLDANMTAFQTSYYVLLTMGLLILAGYVATWCKYSNSPTTYC